MSSPYSPECVEEEFSEVHGIKQPLRRSGKHSTTAWWHPFSVKTLRLGSSSCTIVYQGVATRNDATTREFLALRTGTQPCKPTSRKLNRKTNEFVASQSTMSSDRPTTDPSPRLPQHRIGVPLRPRAPGGLRRANSWTRSARAGRACESSRRRCQPPLLCAQQGVSPPLRDHRGNRFRLDARGDA